MDLEITKKYEEEIKEDSHVDELNVKEVAMKLPGIKHKWVARLIKHKRTLYNLEQQKETLIEAALKQLKQRSDIQLSKAAMTAKLAGMDSVAQINAKIDNEKNIIDYLEHVETIFRYMTNDIKNVIDIMKMELT